MDKPFWECIPLHEMTLRQWESLCDGCGKCCLNKLEDEDSGEIVYTSVACRYLDPESCQCSDYANRKSNVPECITLKPDNLSDLQYLPETCAYRILYEGKKLASWHPLVSGDSQSVHSAHMSVRDRTVSEEGVADEDLIHFIIDDV